MGGGKSCSVVGCSNRTVADKHKHFYKFPREECYRDIWLTFTRRGSDYTVKDSSCICEEHFDPSCFIYKKKQQCLAKFTVPTIFYRQTPDCIEKIVLTFDRDVLHYVEEDTLLNPAFDKEKREKELVEKRDRKLKEIGKLCRFCFDHDQDENKLVPIAKLKDYAIQPADMLALVGIDTQFNDVFSRSTCEDCFQQIVTFDGYRRRCQKAQNSLVNIIKEIDQQIQKLRNTTAEPNSWFKPEATWDEYEDDDEGMKDDSCTQNTKQLANEVSFQQIIIKQEKDEASDGDFFDYSANIDDGDTSDIDFQKKDVDSEDELEGVDMEMPAKIKKKKSGTAKQRIPKDPNRPHNQREYECFFCHVKFAGNEAFKKHKCDKKELTCEVQNCGKIFTKLSGFNAHITKVHKLPKMSRLYCSSCRFSSVTTEEDFKEHCRLCEKSAEKEIYETSVTCETCGKHCPTMKSYSVHVMFHKISEPYTPPKKWVKKRGVFMCESCGKEFATNRYLVDHVKRLHTEPDLNATILTCDQCGKTRTSRYALNKHIKTVHTVAPEACKVCGKVFKNKTLVSAHMLYHKESKRIHFCSLCPDKPPYWTAVQLKRHQESNHGYGNGYQCEICLTTYRTRPGLSQHMAAVHSVPRNPTQQYHAASSYN